MIYFDNAATSFHKPMEVKNKVINSMNNLTANPGRSGHNLSMRVAEEIFEVRESVKKFFGADGYDVIFTKNCTEALNLAILGYLKQGDHVIASCYEHNSVLRPLEYLKGKVVDVTILDCDMRDLPNEIEKAIRENTKLVITTQVSNVTGDVCDVDKVGKICRAKNIRYLVDGAQSAGHMRIDLDDVGIDMFSIAGHKGLLSLTGVGALIVRQGIKLDPILFGGTGTDSINLTQPIDSIEGFESGTVATISILSLGAGIKFLSKNFEKIIKKEEILSKYLYNSLKKLDFLKIYSKPNTSNVVLFNMDNCDSSSLGNYLNDAGICVRSGLHCAPLVHKHLGTLEVGAVRVSIDFNNRFEEIDKLVDVLNRLYYSQIIS